MTLATCLMLTVRADYGGGPEHILSLMRGLSGKYRLLIGAPGGQVYSGRFAEYAQVHPLPFRRFSLLAFVRLARLIRREDVRLIHSHGKGAGIYGRLLGLVTGRPVVHTFHGFHYRHLGAAKRWVYLALERALARRSSALLNVSATEQDSCARVGILDRVASTVVPNGVVVAPYQRAAMAAQAQRPWVLINVARHESEKGVDGLVRMARVLSDQGLHYRLWLVGDGDQHAQLQAQARLAGVADRIDFLGFRDDVASLLRSADIFVSASHGEGMPLTVLEAMAAGLPAVVSDVLGNCDVVVDRQTGFLFPLAQPAAGAAAVARLMADPALYDRCARAAYESVREHYSVDVMCQRIAAVYEKVMDMTEQDKV
jgi:glycosyltransferase involved in cell wall biosynthesis